MSFVYRGAGIDSSWLGFDGAGPSTGVRSGSLGRVQMMMRHLAAVGETYAQTALEDAAWSLLAMHPSQAAGTSSSPTPPANPTRNPDSASGLRLRTPHGAAAANDNIAHIMAMAETVREVLPHIPDEIIFQVHLKFTPPPPEIGSYHTILMAVEALNLSHQTTLKHHSLHFVAFSITF